MTDKHTPGPWFADVDGFGHHRVGSFGHDNYDGTAIHARIQDNGSGYATVGANARLIAAAPDMLAVLENAVFTFENRGQVNSTFLADARAAIAKAKGGAA